MCDSLVYLCIVPSSAPVSPWISAVTSSSFLVSWGSLPPEDHNGIVRHYTVNIREVNTGRSFHLEALSTSITVQFLHPNYKYTCGVAAVTVGPGPFSLPVNATTLEAGKMHTP